MAREEWFVNPRRGRAKQRRPRLRIRGTVAQLGSTSPFKGRVTKINPLYREVMSMAYNPRRRRRHHHRRHSYRRNPGGGPVAALESTFKHPGQAIAEGGVGIVAAYMTVAVPNWILPFPGVDLMSKILRAATRVAAGGLVTMVGQKMHFAGPAFAGAAIGSVGATILDLLNTRVILGQGDTGQTPMSILQGVGLDLGGVPTGTAGYVGTRTIPRSLNGYVGGGSATPRSLSGLSPRVGMAGADFNHPTGVIPQF